MTNCNRGDLREKDPRRICRQGVDVWFVQSRVDAVIQFSLETALS